MPNLIHSLQSRDLNFLRAMSEKWGVELTAADFRSALERIASLVLQKELVEEVVEALPLEAQDALNDLLNNSGRLVWSLFERRHGEVRNMGAARRERERPDLTPVSPAEQLWYQGFIGRAFFDTENGLVEHAYIPDDLALLLPIQKIPNQEPLGRPASPKERAIITPANDCILDQATTLLAGLRMELDEPYQENPPSWPQKDLTVLLQTAGLLTIENQPIVEPIEIFLTTKRSEALAFLCRAWLKSNSYDELRLLPQLSPEGNWKNDPQQCRERLLGFITSLPAGTWWSLSAWVASIKQRYPDFQRPGGNYDGYYLREIQSGEFLRGFQHWDKVDGALVQSFVVKTLHGLGIVDLARAAADSPPTAFRLSSWALALLKGMPPEGLESEDQKIYVRSEGRISVPRLAPRAARYQLARFAEWLPPKKDEYWYKITPTSLSQAQKQGLKIPQLIHLLARHSQILPTNLTTAIKRWDQQGCAAQVEKLTILRLNSPELLQELRQSRAARFLGELIGPTIIAIKPGADEKVLEILTELGYLGEKSKGE